MAEINECYAYFHIAGSFDPFFAFFLCLKRCLLNCRARSDDAFLIFGNRDPRSWMETRQQFVIKHFYFKHKISIADSGL